MKEEEDYDSILKQIEDKIASSGRFFKGAILSVKYRGKKLTEEQERKLFELLRDKSGAKIKSLEEDTEEPVKPEPCSSSQDSLQNQNEQLLFQGIGGRYYKISQRYCAFRAIGEL